MMGCLFALFAGCFPRLALFIIWVASPAMVGAAFGTWIVPLLGIIFLPFATLIYVLLYTPGVGLVSAWSGGTGSGSSSPHSSTSPTSPPPSPAAAN